MKTETPDQKLLRACLKGQGQAALRALEAGANPNSMFEKKTLGSPGVQMDGARALELAAAAGLVDVARKLISTGSDVNARGLCGASALHAALARPSMVELLLEAGAAVDAKDDGGRTPLLRACGMGRGFLAVNEPSNPFEVGVIGFEPCPPVPQAVLSARLLLSAGANPNARDHSKRAAASFAVESDNDEMLSTLISAGADIHAKSHGLISGRPLSLLEQACRYGKPRCLATLVAAGARLEDGAPKSALYWAIFAAQPACVALLLKAGSKLPVADARRMLSSDLTKTPANREHIDRAISMYESQVLSAEISLNAKSSKRKPL